MAAPNICIDVACGVAVISTVIGWLPSIGAGLAVVWYLVQIWESKTGRGWRGSVRKLLERVFR